MILNYLHNNSVILLYVLPNNGGRLINDTRRPPMTETTKRTRREKKFPPGSASLPVIATRMPQICRQMMVICKINPKIPCGGSRNMSLILSNTVGFSGSGFASCRHGRARFLRTALFEVLVFGSEEISFDLPFSVCTVCFSAIVDCVVSSTLSSVLISHSSISVNLSSISVYSEK